MRIIRRLVIVYLAAALLLALTVKAIQLEPVTGTTATSQSATNAAWIDHNWVASPPSPRNIDILCTTLTRHQIGMIYVHVGPADASGNVAQGRAPYASRFVAMIHSRCPGVRVLAWIGQLLPTWDGLVNLQSSSVRAGLVRAAAHFVTVGFDGVQFDLEPVRDGDPAYLALLRSTRKAIAGHWLAVASPAIMPPTGLPPLPHLRLPLTPWSSGYYTRVAELADEIDPMLYMTGLRDAGAYGVFVANQARSLTETLRGSTIRLGVPAFSGQGEVFDDRAENLSASLAGIERAFAHGALPAAIVGIAIYPLWDVTPAGWAAVDAWDARISRS